MTEFADLIKQIKDSGVSEDDIQFYEKNIKNDELGYEEAKAGFVDPVYTKSDIEEPILATIKNNQLKKWNLVVAGLKEKRYLTKNQLKDLKKEIEKYTTQSNLTEKTTIIKEGEITIEPTEGRVYKKQTKCPQWDSDEE